LRIVLDATVLVRAHPRSRSAGRKLLNAVLEGRHTLLLSNEIIVETTRVLRYPRLQTLHALTEEELYAYAQFLQEVCQTVVLDHPYHAPLRDPNDLDVMQTAERGDADVLAATMVISTTPRLLRSVRHVALACTLSQRYWHASLAQ
jgi:putative PIN family toxin of toxin-antitoxin system